MTGHLDDEMPTTTDLDALDVAIDRLGRRAPVEGDEALALLARFARSVDERAAQTRRAGTSHVAGRRRVRRWLRLVTAPAFALVVLGIAVPLSAAPSAPLRPLHELVFGGHEASPADRVRMLLLDASTALHTASVSTGQDQVAELDDARRSLAEARALLPDIADNATRAQLDAELTELEDRAADIATADDREGNDDQGGDDDQDGDDEPGRGGDQGESGGDGPPGQQGSGNGADQHGGPAARPTGNATPGSVTGNAEQGARFDGDDTD